RRVERDPDSRHAPRAGGQGAGRGRRDAQPRARDRSRAARRAAAPHRGAARERLKAGDAAFLEMAESAYRLGRATLFELLDARRTQLEAADARLELLG